MTASPSATTPDRIAGALRAIASARGGTPARDWFSTGASVGDRFSSHALDALLGTARPAGSSPIARFRAACGFVLASWARMWAARRSRRGLGALPRGADVAVLRSWAHLGAFGADGFSDPYFRGLAGWLAARGRDVVVVVGALSEHVEVYRAAAAAGRAVLPEHAFLRIGDPLVIAWQTLRARPRAAAAAFEGHDVTALLQAAIDEEHARRQVFANRLQARIAVRIAERTAPGLVVLTHEGYAWERQFVLGVRGAVPAAWVVGYQHAPVTPGATALFATDGLAPREAGLPDRIVTSGRAAAGELVRRGYPAAAVAAGPSLRTARPEPAPHVVRRTAPGDVLVVLGDFGRSIRMIRALRDLPGLVAPARVVVRPHPLAPAERLAGALGFDLRAAGFALSHGHPLAHDLANASAVVYDASAAAFEALAAGVPAVHIDLGDDLSLDPAAGCAALRAEARDDSGVASALDAFAALSDDDYASQAAEARAFVDASLGEVSDETLAAFLPPEGDRR